MSSQVGYKSMQYLQLHAEAVLDVVEVDGREIQFRAIAGDFCLLKGKFMLETPEPEVQTCQDLSRTGVTNLLVKMCEG